MIGSLIEFPSRSCSGWGTGTIIDKIISVNYKEAYSKLSDGSKMVTGTVGQTMYLVMSEGNKTHIVDPSVIKVIVYKC